jgi:hypothetical protein
MLLLLVCAVVHAVFFMAVLMLARVVAAPRFHQLPEPAVPRFAAAFSGLPSLPPLSPRAVALFAAIRHATGLHCG